MTVGGCVPPWANVVDATPMAANEAENESRNLRRVVRENIVFL